jgi:phage terminase large subunit-like protein
MAEACGDWFREFVGVLFGSIIRETGERMVREAMILVPKKNAKTSYGAGLLATALLLNKRPRGEFLFIGPTKAIADLAFEQANGMIESDPEGYLQKRMHVQAHIKQITDRRTKARLLIKSFDSSVLTGVKPSGVLLDELHEISRDAAAQRIIGQLRGGLLPTPEAFLLFITTQSDRPPSGAFAAELRIARKIRDGEATGRMLPILYEFPEDVAIPPRAMGADPPWYNSAYWPMVTPNLGRSISLARLEQDFDRAKQDGLEEVARWASQHLNIQIGTALVMDRWAGADYWDDQADSSLTLDQLILRSEVITIGIDGGGLDDLLGLAVIGRDAATKEWLLWVGAWAHPIVLQRRESITPELKDFAASGDLVVVDRIGQDIDEIGDVCERINLSGKLHAVGLDSVGIGAIVDALAARGISTEDGKVVAVFQGYKLTGAVKTAERKLAEGSLTHGGQPIMSWAVGNARVELKGNAVIVTKQASGVSKIDPLMAMFDAVALMSDNPEAPAVSFYSTITDDQFEKEFGKRSNHADRDVVAEEPEPVHPVVAGLEALPGQNPAWQRYQEWLHESATDDV